MAIRNGTPGPDALQGTLGKDSIYGFGGNDTVRGRDGNDFIDGGDGDDFIDGDGGNDTIYGGNGNDTIDTLSNGNLGSDFIDGGDGDDVINGYAGDTLDGGTGNDFLRLNLSNQTVGINFNGSVANHISGVATAQNFETFYVAGGSGNDTIIGGDNDDVLSGNAGLDSLDGGAGNDTLKGDTGDILDGGIGIDTLSLDLTAQTGGVNLDGAGSINLSGITQAQNFEIFDITTGSGNDTLIGGAYNDFFFSQAGNDSIDGGDGNDTLNAGNGVDTVFGGSGNDTIISYGGGDSLNGGIGNDVYQLTVPAGTQVQDTGGIDSLTLNSGLNPVLGLAAGALGTDRVGTSLIIDLDKNGTYDAANDLTILDYFATSGGAGTGVIENVAGLSSTDILNFFPGSANTPPTVTNINVNGTEDNVYTFDAATFTAAFADTNGDSLTQVQITTLPSNGTLSLNGINVSAGDVISVADLSTLTFTPAANFNGPVSFGWNGFDGSTYANSSANVTLNIAAVNDAPTVANPIANQAATEDQAFSFAIPAGTFADVDGDTLSYSVSGLPSWLTFDANTGTFSGTPANGDVGTATITITATDPSGEFITNTFNLAVANTNDAPTVSTPIANQAATEDQVFSFTIPAGTFADVDAGDTLSYSVSGLPSWLTFDANTGTFSGTPANGNVGTTSITVTATDTAGATVSNTFNLAVANVNDTPTAQNDAVTGTMNNPIVINSTTLLGNDIDVDAGDVLSISSVGNATNGTVSLVNGNVVFTPTSGYTGPATFEYTAQDASGAVSTATVAVTVSPFTGTSGADSISGTLFNDVIYGNGGNDTLLGYDGDDLLDGGNGSDRMNGGIGNDTLLGGNGIDTLNGNEGNDFLDGGDLNDFLDGGNGNDTLDGGNGDDRLTGGTGDDSLLGNAGNDLINANDGDDFLFGGDGNDNLNGGAGNDLLVGGFGTDILTGGLGNDIFQFNSVDGSIDAVQGFSVTQDKLQISASGFGGGLTAGTPLLADQFVIGSAAVDANDRFIYNKTTGALFFDADGVGGAAQVQIATLSTNLALTENSFQII